MQGIFPDAAMVRVAVPSTGAPAAALAGTAELLTREAAELAVELGAPVTFDSVGDELPRLELRIDPSLPVPRLWLALSRDVLIAAGPDLDGAVEALSLLRTMRRCGRDRIDARPATTVSHGVERLGQEVGSTYPAFRLRDIDWPSLCDRYRARVDDDDPLPGLQRWVARLDDAHTSVRADTPIGHVDYSARVVRGEVVFMHVPPDSAAADAGIGADDVLLDVDVEDLWSRTGAPAHLRPWYVGRLALAGPAGGSRTYRVRRDDGTVTSFTDEPGSEAQQPMIDTAVSRTGTGLLRITRWRPGVNDLIDDALHELRACDRLVVDLRGNVGGSLVEAMAFRDRFLDRPRRLGTIRFSTGDGGLSEPTAIEGSPSPRPRWRRRTRFITDALTYSASEDAILGLRALDHIDTAGGRSGGGSGRARTIRLLEGIGLHVSTALTYDHDGTCIEGGGIGIDLPLELPSDPHAWSLADASW